MRLHYGAFLLFLSVCTRYSKAVIHRGGILFPRESETRQVTSLDGIWSFVAPNTSVKNPFIGFDQHWYKRELKDVSFTIFSNKSNYSLIEKDSRFRGTPDASSSQLQRHHYRLENKRPRRARLVWPKLFRTKILVRNWSSLVAVWVCQLCCSSCKS